MHTFNRVLVFGDSWTAGHGVEIDEKHLHDSFCGPICDQIRHNSSWVRYLSDRLGGVPFANFGVCGFSNNEIVDTVRTHRGAITSEDLVVVMWSAPNRGPNTPSYDFNELTEYCKGLEYFVFNSFYPHLWEHKNQVVDSHRYLLPDLTMHDFLTEYERVTHLPVWQYGYRKWDDHGKEIPGVYHPNQRGYRIIGELIYEKIYNFYTNV